jgi:hypothetical protein
MLKSKPMVTRKASRGFRSACFVKLRGVFSTPNELVRVEREAGASDVLELHQACAGGAAVIIEPAVLSR